MIRLATVFSGIGAIEHALDRMNIENKIVFACDNGDVEILTKDIGMNLDEIKLELDVLKKTIENIQFNDEVEDLYKNQLKNMLIEALSEYSKVYETIKSISPSEDNIVAEALEKILQMKDVK